MVATETEKPIELGRVGWRRSVVRPRARERAPAPLCEVWPNKTASVGREDGEARSPMLSVGYLEATPPSGCSCAGQQRDGLTRRYLGQVAQSVQRGASRRVIPDHPRSCFGCSAHRFANIEVGACHPFGRLRREELERRRLRDHLVARGRRNIVRGALKSVRLKNGINVQALGARTQALQHVAPFVTSQLGKDRGQLTLEHFQNTKVDRVFANQVVRLDWE
jgi:hypothetical protein